MPLGLYLSIPFCRTKCSYCNFASDVFSRIRFDGYVERVCADLTSSRALAESVAAVLDDVVDSVYLGGGSPTILEIGQLERVFAAIRKNFQVTPEAEITVECAPGTLNDPLVAAFGRWGVNRVSLGVQSFVDREARAVGRLHTREKVLEDITRLRAAGILNINVDLIAGLPYQTAESWKYSVAETLATGAPHVSVYMLEVDDDSRLGKELIAGGTRYHAHHVPNEDRTADFYETACRRLGRGGVAQYEISNFARAGGKSRHNLKYWMRQPYFGVGVDAHSMLLSRAPGGNAIRFAAPESLDRYVAGDATTVTSVGLEAALEEEFFLGLRLNAGVRLPELIDKYGETRMAQFSPAIKELISDGLLARASENVYLTPQGRLLSNEVFQRFLATA